MTIKQRVVYAWKENGKFFLSPIPYDPARRQPANWYDSDTELAADASMRGVRVEWAKETLNG